MHMLSHPSQRAALVGQHKQAMVISPVPESEELTSKSTVLKGALDRPHNGCPRNDLPLHQTVPPVPENSVPEYTCHPRQRKTGTQALSPQQSASWLKQRREYIATNRDLVLQEASAVLMRIY